ncbi:MAG: hypothetical protein JRI25_04420 [Deltaproteobacteria bacterium]|nr:hypothetical protein [Deltaproteobacteria bacterium]
MSKWKGKLKRVDLGAGVWVLKTKSGRKYQLDGPIPEDLEGEKVVVEGKKESLLGFGMTGGGSGIRVSKVRRA